MNRSSARCQQESALNGFHPFAPLQSDGSYRWQDIAVKTYPAAGSRSSGMSKQVLFEGSESLPVEIRYFESEPGGYSALETHAHVHHVVIVRGYGHALLGDRIRPVKTHDSLHIASWTYHQFYAADDSHLGFLCMVHPQRDRPSRPGDEQIAKLLSNPTIKDWIRF